MDGDADRTLRDEELEKPRRALQPLGPLLFRLLCADDLSQPPQRIRLQLFSEVRIFRARKPESAVKDGALQLGIADGYASGRHARLFREGQRWLLEDIGSTNGTFVDGERIGAALPLRDGALLEVGHTFFLFRASASGLAGEVPAGDPLTLNPEWEAELRKVSNLARSGQEMLVRGESGAGKEILARFIHESSERPGALVSLNCAALPESLQEDELFGHAKGAFSGAQSDRPGLIRAAHNGTLFLDEVGDMPQPLQAKLLRVLEDRRVRPLGSEQEIPVDVRVVAATHRELDELRHDLVARLGLQVRVPPVRERREDLALFLRRFAEGARFEADVLRLLLRYDWPLNVREVRKVLSAAAALAKADGTPISVAHLPESMRAPRRPQPLESLSPEDEALKQQLVKLLAQHQGNVSAVAREMNKGRTQIRRWMERFNLD